MYCTQRKSMEGKKNKLLGTNTKSPNPLTFLSLSSKEEHKATLFPCISPWIDYCKCLLNCDALENTEVLLAPCFLLCGVCPLLIAGELQHCYMARGSRALWEKKKKKELLAKITSVKTLHLMHSVIYNHSNKAPVKGCQHYKISGASKRTPNSSKPAPSCILKDWILQV